MRSRFTARGGALVFALLLTMLPVYTAPTRADEAAPEYEPAELVLKLFAAGDLAAVAAQHGLALPPLDQFGTRPIYRLRIADGVDPDVKDDQIIGDSRVQYAEPNYTTQAPESRRKRLPWVIGEDAGGYAAQWAPAKLRLGEAHSVTTGSGMRVAVLDTGVDRTHPALAGRLLPGFDFVDFDNDPGEEGVYGQDFGFGHGTHVAGLVALAAPAARIMPVRVLDQEGVGNVWVLSEAIAYTLNPDGDPATQDGAHVINMSLGTLRRTELLDELIDEALCNDDDDDDDDDDTCAVSGGSVVIAAAGNGGDSVQQFPAAEQVAGLLAVAASTQADTLASFSTRGPWVRASAPGEQIISSVPGGYASWSGTSMAAPSVAGIAALLRSADRNLDASAVVERIVNTAQPLCGDGPPRIDAAVALGLPMPEARTCTQAYLSLITIGG